jgi:4-hydroxybenzoate polyprenyltransferase
MLTAISSSPTAISQKPFLWRMAEFIKFSHTIFALPFALTSMVVAAHGFPSLSTIFWILICMVGARTAAMSFNRLADWEIDQKNARTAIRSKLISKNMGKLLMIAGVAIFVAACTQLNSLCVILSPVAIAIIFFYSLTKRFTHYSHFFIGLALSVAPVGAWVAVRGVFDSAVPFILAAAVVCWVFGFDLIYALQDMEFDRSVSMNSFPARYGLKPTLRLSLFLHTTSFILLGVFGWFAQLVWPFWMAWGMIALFLMIEQRWAKTGQIDRINQAFFEMNALVSMTLLIGVLCALLIHR